MSLFIGEFVNQEAVCRTGGSNPPPSVLLRACASQDRILVCAEQDALRSLSEGGSTLYYVYLIESLSAGRQRYVGMTDDLRQCLREPTRFSCSSAFLDHVQFLAQLHSASMREDAAEIYARVNHAIAADNRAGIDHSVAADLGSIADDCAEFS